jgi:hypothetical protein
VRITSHSCHPVDRATVRVRRRQSENHCGEEDLQRTPRAQANPVTATKTIVAGRLKAHLAFHGRLKFSAARGDSESRPRSRVAQDTYFPGLLQQSCDAASPKPQLAGCLELYSDEAFSMHVMRCFEQNLVCCVYQVDYFNLCVQDGLCCFYLVEKDMS